VYEFVGSLWENRFPEEERAFMRCGWGEVVKFFQVQDAYACECLVKCWCIDIIARLDESLEECMGDEGR
jgi:hypothetical protein